MNFQYLHRYPFIRLLFPLIAGFLVGNGLFFRGVYVSKGVLAGGLAGLFLLLLVVYFSHRYSLRWMFGCILYLFVFFGGAGGINQALQQTLYSFSEQKCVYRAVVSEQPEPKEHSFLCRAFLEERQDSVCTMPVNRKVLLYISKDSLSEGLRSGDELIFLAHVSPPSNNGNPDEFDYARYLRYKGISGIAFVASGNWKITGYRFSRSCRQIALEYRDRILDQYRALKFNPDEFAVLAALTVGYKEELSEDIRETYSVSGASHVLALSGLHIGFLYMMLLFFLKWLPGNTFGVRLFRAVVIITALWGFAFFTGLSLSVVRSVIMFSLLALSVLSRRTGISLNTLALTACIMLVVHPFWLFDVGFQLSFSAVAAILLLYPWLFRQLPVGNSLLKKVWALMSVSLAAQIGTAPLVLLYFSRFPTHFLLTNLLVIPLVSGIMYATVALLVLTPFPMLYTGFSVVVRSLVDWLNTMVRWVEHLPLASIDRVWIYPTEVFAFYLVLLIGIRYKVVRSLKCLYVLGICILAMGSFHWVSRMMDRPVQSIVFYNVRGCPVVHCIEACGKSWLAYADSIPDERRLSRAVAGYWNRLHLDVPVAITDNFHSSGFWMQDHLLMFGNKRICMVSDNRWRNKTVAESLNIDYLYVCKGYTGKLESLVGLFHCREVILDSSLSAYYKEAYSEECRRLGLHFISLSDEGSVRFLL